MLAVGQGVATSSFSLTPISNDASTPGSIYVCLCSLGCSQPGCPPLQIVNKNPENPEYDESNTEVNNNFFLAQCCQLYDFTHRSMTF